MHHEEIHIKHACVSSRGAQSTELVWILDFKQILLLLLLIHVPKPYNHIVDKSTICIGDDVIRASFSVTDLGVVLDRHLKMSHQISKMVQTCTYKLRLINVIRNKLRPDMGLE